MESKRLLLAIDAPALLHRQYHARGGAGLRDRSGQPAWALHGMLRQILEVVDAYAPDLVLCGLDDRTASRRRERYPDYKAGRAEKDADLVAQLERCSGLLDALGLATLTPPGLEADDVNASAARWAHENGWRCIIVTSDRDAFAHISDSVSVLRIIDGGLEGSPLLTPKKLQLMYGVTAASYLPFAALRGDASDNLPGVDGIGEKSAALLFEAVGSMAAVWADLEHQRGQAVSAALDSLAQERGERRLGASVVRRLSAPGARERYEFNIEMMGGHSDLELGLVPDDPQGPGVLPCDADQVARVAAHFGVDETVQKSVRILGHRA